MNKTVTLVFVFLFTLSCRSQSPQLEKIENEELKYVLTYLKDFGTTNSVEGNSNFFFKTIQVESKNYAVDNNDNKILLTDLYIIILSFDERSDLNAVLYKICNVVNPEVKSVKADSRNKFNLIISAGIPEIINEVYFWSDAKSNFNEMPYFIDLN